MTFPTARRRTIALTTLSLAVLLSGCAGAETPEGLASPAPSSPSSAAATATPTASAAPHWAYEGEEGPDHWGELTSAFSTCDTGADQSPIDLPSNATPEEDNLVLAYSPTDEEAIDTGHTLQLNAQPGAGLTYNGVDYALQQLHYHDPSEHTVDGDHPPIEFHFVNKDADGDLLVIGVFGIVGSDNPSFDPLVKAAQADSTPTPDTVDLQSMMPDSLLHYAYTGSLTTPPCSEGVQWLVMETPVELGQDQIDTLTSLYEGNNRPVQPLNGREIHVGN